MAGCGSRAAQPAHHFRDKEATMHWGEWGFFGMHMFWWIFWIVAVVLLFSLAPPVPKGRVKASETPLEILQRRYARGEIDTTQYEERKARLTRDQPLV